MQEENRVSEPVVTWDLRTASKRVSAGLPSAILDTIQQRLELSNYELAELVMMSPRTLNRRRSEGKLSRDESERAYRVARLAEIAAHILGGEGAARAWMKESNYALGNEIPIVVARTGPGVMLAERVLRQIEHGIMM